MSSAHPDRHPREPGGPGDPAGDGAAGETDILDEIKAEVYAELEEERPPHAGPTSQVAAALVMLAIGIAGLVLSYGYGLGQLTAPGPGLWPFAISVLITGLSAALIVTGRHGTDTEQFSKASILPAVGIVTFVALAALMPLIGFEIPALLLCVVWLRFLGRESWRSTAVVSLVTVAAFYVLFIVLLQVPLPHLI